MCTLISFMDGSHMEEGGRMGYVWIDKYRGFYLRSNLETVFINDNDRILFYFE